MDLIDIGANLSHESYRDDLPDVLERARTMGVRRLIVTGTSLASSEAAIDMATRHAEILWATAGVHPHSASEYDDHVHERLRALIEHPVVVACGECGLDYHRDFSPRQAQRDAFSRQLDLAGTQSLPVFLHQREAHEDFLAILREQVGQLCGGVAHCFTNGSAEMDDYLNLGLHIGITGWICDERRADALRDAVRSLPLDRVLVETDAPYLLPRSLRPAPAGRRNEPAYLPEVVRTLATYMGQSADAVAAASTENAERLFRLKGTK